jgi:hypothetical protein
LVGGLDDGGPGGSLGAGSVVGVLDDAGGSVGISVVPGVVSGGSERGGSGMPGGAGMTGGGGGTTVVVG